MANELQLIEDKEREFSELRIRQRKDRDLYHGEQFVMKNFNKQITPNVVNVTLNDARLWAKRAIGTLGGTVIQTVVEGKDLNMMEDKETSLIEGFLKALFLAAGKRLYNRGIPDLDMFQNEQIAISGRVASRNILRTEKGEFVPDILPLDTFYFVYELGLDGMEWGSYKTWRSKARLKIEYDIDYRGDNAGVQDFWNDKENVVFIDGKEKVRKKHKLGYAPFTLSLSTSGSFMQDKESFKYSGESIFGPIRELYETLDLLATIIVTTTQYGFNPPMQKPGQPGAKKPDKPPYGVGAVVPVNLGEEYKGMPLVDINNAARFAYSIVYSRIQQGGVSTVELGNLDFPLSGAALTILLATKDPVFLPMFQALAVWKQETSKMAIDQYTSGGMKAELGEEGEKMLYLPTQLKGDYTIKYKFFNTSPVEDLARYSVAGAAREWLPSDMIRRDVLALENPDQVSAQIQAEKAELANPMIASYNRVIALIEQGDDVKAKLERAQFMRMLKAPEGPPEGEGQMPKATTPELPLFEGGGGGRRPTAVPTESEIVAKGTR